MMETVFFIWCTMLTYQLLDVWFKNIHFSQVLGTTVIFL